MAHASASRFLSKAATVLARPGYRHATQLRCATFWRLARAGARGECARLAVGKGLDDQVGVAEIHLVRRGSVERRMRHDFIAGEFATLTLGFVCVGEAGSRVE